jgi:hypothetical protein
LELASSFEFQSQKTEELPQVFDANERTLTSCYRFAIPTHGFTVVVSVSGGTPSTKPLNCKFKICLGRLGGDTGAAWTHHTGDDSKLVFANFSFAPSDITWMSLYYRSLFRSSFVNGYQDNKKPCLLSVSRVWKFLFSRYLLTFLSATSGFWPQYAMDRLRQNILPVFDRL